MTKLSATILSIALTLVGNQALAHPLHRVVEKETVITTPSTDSKENAYQDAKLILRSLRESSSEELKEQLNVFSLNFVKDSISLQDGAHITAQEYMNEDGELRYKGLLSVHYEYEQIDRNN